MALWAVLCAVACGLLSGGLVKTSVFLDQLQSMTTCPYFAPDDDVAQLLIECIEKTTEAIYIAAFMMTDRTIVKALIDAHKRGVSIIVVIDAACIRTKRECISQLCQAHIPVRLYRPNTIGKSGSYYSIMHHKFFLCFGVHGMNAPYWVISGSYNPTYAAGHGNQENVMASCEPLCFDRFHTQFKRLVQRSERYIALKGDGKKATRDTAEKNWDRASQKQLQPLNNYSMYNGFF